MNVDFIALGAACAYDSFDREVLVIGMIPMPPGGHSAENIKTAVEKMVNRFKFEKTKINGIDYSLRIE